MCIGVHKFSWALLIVLGALGLPFAQTYNEWAWALLGALIPDTAYGIRTLSAIIKRGWVSLRPRAVGKTYLGKYSRLLEIADRWSHSLIALIAALSLSVFTIIPKEFALMYAVHLAIDVFSHRKLYLVWPISLNMSPVSRSWWDWAMYRRRRYSRTIVSLSSMALIMVVTVAIVKETLL